MKDTMGIIICSMKNAPKGMNTAHSAAMLPIGGSYRTIDFALSNMVNSGIQRVAVLPGRNFCELARYLGDGSEWGLKSNRDGLYILKPCPDKGGNTWFWSMLSGLAGNLELLRSSNHKHVVVCSGESIYNTAYYDIMNFHREKNADITLLYTDNDIAGTQGRGHKNCLHITQNGRVMGAGIRDKKEDTSRISMRSMILERKLLETLLAEFLTLKKTASSVDYLNRIFWELNVYGYFYPGYFINIDSIYSFYRANLDLLAPRVRQHLLMGPNMPYTKIMDIPPAKYGSMAAARNSIVSHGSVIRGVLENSIVFPNVSIRQGAKLVNCIVLSDATIEEDAELENVIIGQNVTVTKGKRLKGREKPVMLIPQDTIV